MGTGSSNPVDESTVEEAVEQANRTLEEYSQRHLLSAFTVDNYCGGSPEEAAELIRDELY